MNRVPPSSSMNASLSHDLTRFILPLARSSSFQYGDVSSASSARFVMADTPRTPGVRAAVTNFPTRINALLNRPLLSSNPSVSLNVPLYRCPLCPNSGLWWTPAQITRHLGWLHAAEGDRQSDFAAHNAHEMTRLCQPSPSPSSPAPTSRVMVMLDVANIELNGETLLAEFLENEACRAFFQRVACAFVCVHEMFITHASMTPHVFFQLARLHPLSDIFTVYATTRNESGDLNTAALMGELLLRHNRAGGPAIVLVTRDQALKLCVSEMFAGVAGRCGRVFLPRVTTGAVMNSLKEASNALLGGL